MEPLLPWHVMNLEESCFCKVFGIDCADPAADVAVWMAEKELYWKPLTEKGQTLTESVKELLESADQKDEEIIEEEKAKIRSIVEKLPYSGLSLEGWNGDVLTEKFNSTVWEELYKPCLACGPVHLYVRPARVMTSKIMIPVMAYYVTAAGIPACILILP